METLVKFRFRQKTLKRHPSFLEDLPIENIYRFRKKIFSTCFSYKRPRKTLDIIYKVHFKHLLSFFHKGLQNNLEISFAYTGLQEGFISIEKMLQFLCYRRYLYKTSLYRSLKGLYSSCNRNKHFLLKAHIYWKDLRKLFIPLSKSDL